MSEYCDTENCWETATHHVLDYKKRIAGLHCKRHADYRCEREHWNRFHVAPIEEKKEVA